MFDFFKNKPFEANVSHLTNNLLAIQIREEGRFESKYFPTRYFNPFFTKEDNPINTNNFYYLTVEYKDLKETSEQLKKIKSFQEFYNKYLKTSYEQYDKDLNAHLKWLDEKEKLDRLYTD